MAPLQGRNTLTFAKQSAARLPPQSTAEDLYAMDYQPLLVMGIGLLLGSVIRVSRHLHVSPSARSTA